MVININRLKLKKMKHTITLFLGLLFVSTISFAQKTIEASDIMSDIKNGKSIEYVLTGIPSNKFDHNGKQIRTLTKTEQDLRNKIILSSQKVIDDMNLGFKRAFKGTKYENRGDIITLKIEKDGSMPAGTKNYTVSHVLDGVEQTATIEVVQKTHLGDLQRNHIY